MIPTAGCEGRRGRALGTLREEEGGDRGSSALPTPSVRATINIGRKKKSLFAAGFGPHLEAGVGQSCASLGGDREVHQDVGHRAGFTSAQRLLLGGCLSLYACIAALVSRRKELAYVCLPLNKTIVKLHQQFNNLSLAGQ